MEEVLQLYRDKYFNFNMQHFHEKLRDLHGIHLSYKVGEDGAANSRTGKASYEAGITSQAAAPAVPGMMLDIDGSEHRWFGDERYYELIVIMDDATSEIYHARLVEAESTRTVMAALRDGRGARPVLFVVHSDRPATSSLLPSR